MCINNSNELATIHIIIIICYYPWIEIILIYYSFRLARIYSEYIIPILCIWVATEDLLEDTRLEVAL